MPSVHSAATWLEEIISAASELAETTFGASVDGAERTGAMPKGLEGSLLPIQHGEESLQLGVLASHDGCIDLTRALLQLEDGEEPEDDAIPDAVGEILNILAGIVQRRIAAQDGSHVSLGLPVFVRGEITAPHKAETAIASLNLGPALAKLVVVRGELHEN